MQRRQSQHTLARRLLRPQRLCCSSCRRQATYAWCSTAQQRRGRFAADHSSRKKESSRRSAMADPYGSGDEDDLYAFGAVSASPAVLTSEHGSSMPGTALVGGGGASRLSTASQQSLSNASSRVSTGFRAIGAVGGGGFGAGPTAIGVSRPETSRPQTSINPAGWPGSMAPGGMNSVGATFGVNAADTGPLRGPIAKPQPTTPEEIAKEMEREVTGIVEESAFSATHGDVATALKKAKHAAMQNKRLETQRASAGLDPNVDLTFAVHLNLAVQFEANRLWDQAIKTYKFIVAQKHYTQAGRLHVNIGNIFYEQEKFSDAIKHYKMAVDKLPATAKELKFRIQRNIGNTYMRMGKLRDAAAVYEGIMNGSPEPRSAINLLVCYFALGDKEKMKQAFVLLLNIRRAAMSALLSPAKQQQLMQQQQDGILESPRGVDPESLLGGGAGGSGDDEEPSDELFADKRRRKREADKLIVSAAQLIAPVVGLDFSSGYDWLVETLGRNGCSDVANDLEISKAMTFMRQRNFDRAIETLKSFERRDSDMASPAATNLSFLYLLEQDLTNAERYADLALQADRYNSKALVNKGTCKALRGDLATARDFFLEALGTDADCIEAIYNLGLLSKRSGDVETALKSFSKLHMILPADKEVVAQIALLFERRGDVAQAIRWFKTLNTMSPTDPGVLAKLGKLHSKTDDTTAYQYYVESHRFFPANLHVVSWLGAYYVRSEAHEKAVPFFQRASQLQPSEVQWQLMVAMCHRRTGAYQQALEIYQDIHKKNPTNSECLKALVQLATDLGLKEELHEYASALRDIEQQKMQREDERRAAEPTEMELEAQRQQQQQQAAQKEEEEWSEVDVGKLL